MRHTHSLSFDREVIQLCLAESSHVCECPHSCSKTSVCVQVQAADSVLVVGGGSTGVEMAAEIKTEYPDKKVTRSE